MTDQATDHQVPQLSIKAPRRRVDLTTIFGLFIAAGLIGTALVMGGQPGAFLNAPAFLIVFGGTLAVTSVSFSGKEIRAAGKIIGKTLFQESREPKVIATNLLDISDLARRKGLLALQGVEEDLKKDKFLHKAVQLVKPAQTADCRAVQDCTRGWIDLVLQILKRFGCSNHENCCGLLVPAKRESVCILTAVGE